MTFLTDADCKKWTTRDGVDVVQDMSTKLPVLRVDLNIGAGTLLAAARLIEGGVTPWNTCLLWVTSADIWLSSTNLHLYYTIRRAYGNKKLLAQAPGHAFLNYEKVDLTTFLQVGLLSGWDMHLVTDMAYGQAFVSHDGWVKLWRSNEDDLSELERDFRKIQCEVKLSRQ